MTRHAHTRAAGAPPDPTRAREPAHALGTPERPSRTWWAALALGAALSLLALLQVAHKVERGQQALLRWRGELASFSEGGQPYHALDRAAADIEGYPTPPITAMFLAPLLRLGDLGGCLALALVKLGCAWALFAIALRLGFGRARAAPAWVLFALLAAMARIELSDFAHGNINLIVAGCVGASAWSWSRGRDATAGLWAAAATACKVTPVLLLAYFAWQRAWRACAAFALALAALWWLLPALWLGFDRNAQLWSDWARQMLLPFARGDALTLTQTEQINQSLLGVLARLTTDAVAIQARPPVHLADVRLGWLALSPGAFRALLHACQLGLVGALAWSLRPRLAWAAGSSARAPREGARVLAAFGLLTLAMCFLSERSWKQHYVFALFALASLCAELHSSRGRRTWTALALAAFIAAQGLSGDALLGARASDWAEALGIPFWGAVCVFAACNACELSRRSRNTGRLLD